MQRLKNSWPTRLLLIGSAIGAGAVLPLVCLPVGQRVFSYGPAKRLSYDETVGEIRTRIAGSPAKIRPECATGLLEHGHPTERVFVLMHGLSNCPAQFSKLGRLLFERGHNVLIPRTPYHGEQNRLTTDWSRLTANDLLDTGNRAVDLARGLGNKVIAVGLSVNGTTVAWLAQNRADVDKAVLFAPFLAPLGLPNWALAPVERVLLRLPNMFFWWDPRVGENIEGPPYAYPRFPTRVIGETMLLGRQVLAESRSQPPRSPSILVVTSASDTAANNRVTEQLVANWRQLRPDGIETFAFPASDKVPHDFIDPNQPNQRVDFVYPKIIGLLEK